MFHGGLDMSWSLGFLPGGWPKAVAAWTSRRQQRIPKLAKVAKAKVWVKVRLREVQKWTLDGAGAGAGWYMMDRIR